jgi:hypothetical protein
MLVPLEYSRGAYRYTYEVLTTGGKNLAGKRPISEEDWFSDGDDWFFPDALQPHMRRIFIIQI